MKVVKINGNLLKRPQYAEAQIKEGDDVMILHLISGG
jgi:thiamine biosynthesis protein ThiS